MSARIEKLLGFASLQGLPMTGYRRFGVPAGGAFDQQSLRLGNALLGNEPGAHSIELSNAAIEIAFSFPTRIAVVGAPVGQTPNAAFDVAQGQTLSCEAPRKGLRAYVCVLGGWIPDGVDSPLARSGRPWAAGDVLGHGEAASPSSTVRLARLPSSLMDGHLRIVKGPQPVADLANATFRVSNNSDRTGIRLDGLLPRDVPELTSEPACVGAIQLTPSGQLILIGPDGPTIGGYPKVAVVCSADLDRLAHIRPGQSVTFEEVGLEEAKELARAQTASLDRSVAELQIARK